MKLFAASFIAPALAGHGVIQAVQTESECKAAAQGDDFEHCVTLFLSETGPSGWLLWSEPEVDANGLPATGGKQQIQIVTTNPGWLSVALSPNGGMRGSDYLVVGKSDSASGDFPGVMSGDFFAMDMWVDDYHKPIPDEYQHWSLEAASEVDGRRVFNVSRAFDTGDAFDLLIRPSVPQTLLWAYGASDSLAYHGSTSRGSLPMFWKDSARPQFSGTPQEITLVMHETDGTSGVDVPVALGGNGYVCSYFDALEYFPDGVARHITDIDIVADNELVLHHMILFSCAGETFQESHKETSFDCIQMPRGCETMEYVWAVGGAGRTLPEEVGILFGGSEDKRHYLLQMHYYTPPGTVGDQRDASGFKFQVTDTLRQYNMATWLTGPTNLLLHPATVRNREDYYCSPGCSTHSAYDQEINIFGAGVHMHGYGKYTGMRRVNPDGSAGEFIFEERVYDFEHQQLHFPLNTTLRKDEGFAFYCEWDTSAKLENYTPYGDGSENEMCFGVIMYWPAAPNQFGRCQRREEGYEAWQDDHCKNCKALGEDFDSMDSTQAFDLMKKTFGKVFVGYNPADVNEFYKDCNECTRHTYVRWEDADLWDEMYNNIMGNSSTYCPLYKLHTDRRCPACMCDDAPADGSACLDSCTEEQLLAEMRSLAIDTCERQCDAVAKKKDYMQVRCDNDPAERLSWEPRDIRTWWRDARMADEADETRNATAIKKIGAQCTDNAECGNNEYCRQGELIAPSIGAATSTCSSCNLCCLYADGPGGTCPESCSCSVSKEECNRAGKVFCRAREGHEATCGADMEGMPKHDGFNGIRPRLYLEEALTPCSGCPGDAENLMFDEGTMTCSACSDDEEFVKLMAREMGVGDGFGCDANTCSLARAMGSMDGMPLKEMIEFFCPNACGMCSAATTEAATTPETTMEPASSGAVPGIIASVALLAGVYTA